MRNHPVKVSGRYGERALMQGVWPAGRPALLQYPPPSRADSRHCCKVHDIVRKGSGTERRGAARGEMEVMAGRRLTKVVPEG